MRGFLLAVVMLGFWGSIHAGQWRYPDDVDKMTGKKTSYAVLTSDNTLSLGSPYAGLNHGQITVRRHPQYGTDVMIGVDKGQILCRSYDGCTIKIRFGDGTAQSFSAMPPADHSSNLVFVSNKTRFIDAARKNTKILVQLPMFREGEQVLEFSTPVQLVWK